MKYILSYIIILFPFICFSQTIQGKVVRIADGDTITLLDSTNNSIHRLQNNDGKYRISYDTIFATVTSILVFSLGILATYINSKIKENKDRKKIRSIVFLNCEELSKELTRQSDAFESIADAINIDANTPIPMSAFCVKSHNLLNDIKYERIYDAFQDSLTDRVKMDKFNTLWANISTVIESISNQKNFAIDFIDRNNNYQKEFEDTLSHVVTIIGNMMTDKHGKFVSEDEHKFFGQVDKINESMQGDSNVPSKVKSHYIEPFLQLFNNPQYYHIHGNGELPNLLRKAQIKFTNLNNHNIMSKENALTLKSMCLSLSINFNEFVHVFKPNKE
jgi:hypothetical protein